jgi:S-formylglutathione hydrolase FrmB
MKKRILLFFAILSIAFISSAANVDTIEVYSNAMQKSYKCVIIKPTKYKKQKIPVVYLLHGYGGWYANWLIRVPELKEYADEYKMMIVCPDGAVGSWYLDSPVDSSYKFETYIGKELPAYIDAYYPTIKSRNARAITGLSMGGHGGLFLGFRQAETFGACGSMSGGVDLSPFPKNWELAKRLGDTITYTNNWKNYSVIHVIENKPAQPLSIIIDCGTEDFFYTVNSNLHQKMLALKIPHDYIERPGKHDWEYWRNAVQYQLLYFKNYFSIK